MSSSLKCCSSPMGGSGSGRVGAGAGRDCWGRGAERGRCSVSSPPPPPPPPPGPLSRPPRNWNPSTMTLCLLRLPPLSLSSQVSYLSRPSTRIGLPFWQYLLMVSAIFPKAEQSMKSTSSRSSPWGVRHLWLTARPKSTTAVWLGRKRNCGSRVRLPARITLLKLAMGPAFQSESMQVETCTTNESIFARAHFGFVAARGAIAVGAALKVARPRSTIVHPHGWAIPAWPLFADLNRLGLDGFHLVNVEMIGLEHEHAQDFFAELHVALDGRPGLA